MQKYPDADELADSRPGCRDFASNIADDRLAKSLAWFLVYRHHRQGAK